MKTVRFLKLAALAIIMAGINACGEKEIINDPEEPAFEVKDLKGKVKFNSDTNKWYIYVHTEGTYDEVQLYFSSSLDNVYKVHDKNIVFSGLAYELKNTESPAGTQCFSIKITFIDNSLN